MNTKTLIPGIVMAAIVIILVGALLMPALADAQQTAGELETLDNNGAHNSYIFGEIDGTETMTYAVDSGKLYINGEETPISHSGTVGRIADSSSGYLGVRNNGTALYWFAATGTGYAMTTIASGATVTITAHQVTDGTNTWTIEDTIYAANAPTSKPMMMYIPNAGTVKSIVNSIDEVRGWTEVTLQDSTKTVVEFSGNTAHALNGAEVTVSAETSPLQGYTDAVKIDSYKLNADGTEYSSLLVLLPMELEAHVAGGSAFMLYGAIPAIVLAGIVVAIVASFLRKDD